MRIISEDEAHNICGASERCEVVRDKLLILSEAKRAAVRGDGSPLLCMYEVNGRKRYLPLTLIKESNVLPNDGKE